MDEWNTDTNNYNFISLSQALQNIDNTYTEQTTDNLYNSNAIVNYEI